MDILELADKIINGKRLCREDNTDFFASCGLEKLCTGADRIRKHYMGDRVDMCAVISGKGGRCPEDCKYCAQSVFNKTGCDVYGFIPEEEIVRACKEDEKEGIHRFSIVTAGKALTGEDFKKAVHAYKTMSKECNIGLCASMGFITKEQLEELKEAGVTYYHHNIETSESYFPKICTTHTFGDKLRTLKNVKETGLKICSGGIIGMGETLKDRISMAFSLAEAGADSIPVNILMPVKGTPLEAVETLSEPEILRTIAMFRYVNPDADIRVAAGRKFFTEGGKKAFLSGASAVITGNMVTTSGSTTVSMDKKMFGEIGRII